MTPLSTNITVHMGEATARLLTLPEWLIGKPGLNEELGYFMTLLFFAEEKRRVRKSERERRERETIGP